MAQNIYDDPDFLAGYSGLPRQLHGLAGAPEWPTLRAMLPDLRGKRVVDLGCGFGWGARWMCAQGAGSILGVDLSNAMIARAKSDTDDDRIVFEVADLERLVLPPASFDVIYSSLAFHYVEDFSRLARTMAAALDAPGRLVFSVEHPIFMAAARPDWILDRHGRRSWPVNSYASEGERRTDWFARDVLKYHRTLGTTMNTLIDAGFTIRRVEEFSPSAAQVRAAPGLETEVERPMMLLMSAAI